MEPKTNEGTIVPTTERRRTLDELALLGDEIFERQVGPVLRSEDDGKYVAIDVNSGDYEINEDDYTAVMNLRSRRLEAEVWLMRAGHPAAYKMRSPRCLMW